MHKMEWKRPNRMVYPEFRFPSKHAEWKNDWLQIIRKCRNDNTWNPSKFSVVCSAHFEEEDLYKTKNGLIRVVNFAVPKKFLFPTPSVQEDLSSVINNSNGSQCSSLVVESAVATGSGLQNKFEQSSYQIETFLLQQALFLSGLKTDDEESDSLVEETRKLSDCATDVLNEATMLEVCIDSLESAINAIHGGADELEVCSSLTEGGLTPSAGLVKQIVQMVNNFCTTSKIHKSCGDCSCDKLMQKPKVNVMIRCRTGSDFCYSEEEMETMLSDVTIYKNFGVDRFVFGALTDSQDIDEINCKKIIETAHPIPVTFHRAFDICNDPKIAINKICELGFNRLLTSGQKPSADDTEAKQLIKSLLKMNDKVQIMPGAGINVDNVRNFADMGCQIVHSSCKRVRYLPEINNAISMGSSDSECIFVTDETIVRNMKEIISVCVKMEVVE